MKKRRLKKKNIANLFLIVFLGFFIYSSIHIFNWYKDNKYTKNQLKVVKEKAEVKFTKDEDGKNLSVNFDELIKANEETVAWINIPGTLIDYSVLKHDDNSYYLNHSFDKTYNGSGWIYADYNTDLDNLTYNNVIYGHSMINRTMFGSLRDVLKNKYLESTDDYYIYLSTPKYNYIFQIFSSYHIEPTDDYIKTNLTKEEFEEWLEMIKKRNIINYKTEVTKEDKILTLSTCYSDSERMAVHAKLISKKIRH